MSKCLDCGCSMEVGICSNCHEELYIQTFQVEHIDSVSSEFAEKANEQKSEIKERNENIRKDPKVYKDLKPKDTYYKSKIYG